MALLFTFILYRLAGLLFAIGIYELIRYLFIEKVKRIILWVKNSFKKPNNNI